MMRKGPGALLFVGLLGVAPLCYAGPSGGESDLVFNTIEPCRILDTRESAEGPLLAGETRAFDVVGEVDLRPQGGESAQGCGIPGWSKGLPQVQVVVVHFVAKQPADKGALRAWASDRSMPKNPTMSFSARALALNVGFGTVTALRQDFPGQDLSVHVSAETHLVAEVVGYYSKAKPELGEKPLAGDTRPGVGALGTRVDGTFDNVTVNGATGITLTNATGGIRSILPSKSLILEEQGDDFGPVRMSLQNRFGVNGVLFEQGFAGVAGALVDFVLKAGNFQRNLRLEARPAQQVTSGAGPEFQFGEPKGVGGGPSLVVADSIATFPRGNVGIGTTAPVTASGGRVLHIDNPAGASALRLGDGDPTGRQWEIQSITNGSQGVLNFRNVTDGPSVVTLQGNGKVGIGSTSPGYQLHVIGENVRVEGNTLGTLPRFSLNFTGGLANEKRWQNYASNKRLTFSALNDLEDAETHWLNVIRGTGTNISNVTFPNGNVGIGDITPTAALEVKVGGTTLADAWTPRSSRRFKENVQTIEQPLQKVMQLRGVTFDWKESHKHSIGLIAEEVGQVLPELVEYEANGQDARSLDYDKLTAVLVEAVKQHQAQLQKLQEQNEALQARVTALEEAVRSTAAAHRSPEGGGGKR